MKRMRVHGNILRDTYIMVSITFGIHEHICQTYRSSITFLHRGIFELHRTRNIALSRRIYPIHLFRIVISALSSTVITMESISRNISERVAVDYLDESDDWSSIVRRCLISMQYVGPRPISMTYVQRSFR